jgi:hypothetical protein
MTGVGVLQARSVIGPTVPLSAPGWEALAQRTGRRKSASGSMTSACEAVDAAARYKGRPKCPG